MSFTIMSLNPNIIVNYFCGLIFSYLTVIHTFKKKKKRLSLISCETKGYFLIQFHWTNYNSSTDILTALIEPLRAQWKYVRHFNVPEVQYYACLVKKPLRNYTS